MEPNVIAFAPRRAKPVVGALTHRYDPNGWLVLSPDVYEWFIRNPEPATLVHQYGFLHSYTRRAFVCVAMADTGFLCGMSNAPYTDMDFDALTLDPCIDDVIRKLGFEPIEV